MEATRTGDTGHKAQTFEGISVCVLPDRPGVARPIDATQLFRDEMGGQPQFSRERHVNVPLWQAIEVGLFDVQEVKDQWDAITRLLLSKSGEETLLSSKGRCRRKECIMTITSVDLTRNETCPHVGLLVVTLIAQYPSAAHEDVPNLLQHARLALDLPNLYI